MDFQGTHSEMHQHGELSRKTHDILMLSTVKSLKEQSDQKDLEIMKLKETNANTNKTLSELKRDFTNLQNKFEHVTKKIETNEEEIIENRTEKSQQLIKDVDDLNKFADRISRLHNSLSEEWLQRNRHYSSTLFQANYVEDKNVKEWNEMVHEINEDENECSYLKSSVNRFKQTIYSTTYEERLKNFFYSAPLGEFRTNFIRIRCSGLTKSICVKWFISDFDNFKIEVEKNEKKKEF